MLKYKEVASGKFKFFKVNGNRMITTGLGRFDSTEFEMETVLRSEAMPYGPLTSAITVIVYPPRKDPPSGRMDFHVINPVFVQ